MASKFSQLVVLTTALFVSASIHADTHRYQVRVDQELKQVYVKANLAGFVENIRSGSGQSVKSVRNPRSCDGTALKSRWGRLRIRGNNPCLQYEFRLSDGSPFGRRDYKPPSGVEVTAPADWLWLPAMGDTDKVRVEFELPENMHLSTPWKPLSESTYEFGKSPSSGRALIVIGDFAKRELSIPGATLRVSILPGVDAEKMMTWLKASSSDVALVAERFPVPFPQVIVVPVGPNPDGEAVPFGRVVRDGGESVHFFVNPAKPLAEYNGDWTATHEFSHLLLPYVHADEKWISEGLASYYQNVLLGRGGVYSEQNAWQRLHRSFERAKETGGDMSPNGTAHEAFWEARMMIYWSGAAIALMADVELRKQGQSLDSVLGRLRDCCLPSDKIWRGRELFDKLDELSNTSVFGNLYQRHANAPGIPDLSQLYQDLGIVPDGKQVVLLDQAKHRGIRVGILGKRENATQLRKQ